MSVGKYTFHLIVVELQFYKFAFIRSHVSLYPTACQECKLIRFHQVTHKQVVQVTSQILKLFTNIKILQNIKI